MSVTFGHTATCPSRNGGDCTCDDQRTVMYHRHVPLPPDAHHRANTARRCAIHHRDCLVESRQVTDREAMTVLLSEPDGTLAWWPA
jgi:hypothetical protein